MLYYTNTLQENEEVGVKSTALPSFLKSSETQQPIDLRLDAIVIHMTRSTRMFSL